MTTIAIVDCETTGFKPPSAILLEVAAIVTDEERLHEKDWINHWWSLFLDQTMNGQNFNVGAMAINHITVGHTKGGGTMIDVERRLKPYDVIVCHNVPFDAQFMPASIAPKWICTLACAKRVWPDVEKHQNMFLRYHHGILATPPYWTNSQMNDAHRALPDCMTTINLLRKMVVDEGHSIEELIGWSPQPSPGVPKSGR
jgi:DNA polymerase III epsilon subunit-like protein